MIEDQIIADPKPKISRKEFAAKIKSKYPQYKDIADDELIDKIVAKYPAYSDTVEPLKKKEDTSPASGIPFENGQETSLQIPGTVDLGKPLPVEDPNDSNRTQLSALNEKTNADEAEARAQLFKQVSPEQQSLDYYKAKKDERLLRENLGIDRKEPEFDPVVTFGKSAWNTLAYQLPSGIAAGLAAASRPSAANPENYDEGKLAYAEDKNREIKSDLLKWAEQRQGEGSELTTNLVSSLDKIHDPIDILNWISYAGGQAAGQIPASIASFGATSIGQEVGSIYLESVQKIAKDKKLSIDEVIKQDLDKPALALAYGTVAGALDYLGAKGATGGLGKQAIKKSLQSRALEIVKSPAVIESSTEYAQQWIEQIGASQAAGDEFGKTWDLANTDQAARDRIESLAQGGVGGQGAHIVTQTFKKQDHALPIRKAEAVPLDEASGGGAQMGPRVSGPGTKEPTNAQGGQPTSIKKVPVSKEEKTVIPSDLKKRGEPVASPDDAKARFGDGERIFGFHEQSETPLELTSVEQMDKFTSDQLLAYPKKENEKTKPKGTGKRKQSKVPKAGKTKETPVVPVKEEKKEQVPAVTPEPIPKEIKGFKVLEQVESTPDGEEVFRVEGDRFLTRDGKELAVAKVKIPTPITPKDIHTAAKKAGIDYESKEFMDKSKELTGKEHLDSMSPEELAKIKDYIETPAPKEDQTPEKARKEGKLIKDGVTYERQAPLEGDQVVKGGPVKLEFANKVNEEGEYAVIEADKIQPSHKKGIKNPLHFLPESQPKSRDQAFGQAGVKGAQDIAAKLDPTKVGESPNPYSGAPTVNSRGEVIQGNARADALQQYWANNQEKDPAGYKEYLVKNAEKFGLDPVKVAAMKNPVLTRMVKAGDARAIELGQYTASDIETGGKRRIEPVHTVNKLTPEDRTKLANTIAQSEGETLSEIIRANTDKILDILYKRGAITETQLETVHNPRTGEINKEGVEDLARVFRHMMFEGGDTNLAEIFEHLPDSVQKGIDKAIPAIIRTKGLNKTMNNALVGYREFQNSGMDDLNVWENQADIFNDGLSPKQIYSPEELNLIRLFDTKKQGEILGKIKEVAAYMADKEGDMFIGPSKGLKAKEAFQKVFVDKGLPENTDSTLPITTRLRNVGKDQFAVTGDTYSIKNRIVALGGIWDKKTQRYLFNNSARPEVEKLLESVEGKNPQAQFAGQRFDGRTVKQVETASKRIGQIQLKALVRRLMSKFPGISEVVTDRKRVQQAWQDFLNRGSGMFASFASPGNKITPEMASKLSQAEAMDRKGSKPFEIWQKTGWFKYKDGKWRYELDGSKAKIKIGDTHLIKAKKNTSESPDNEEWEINTENDLKLSEVIDYPEFFNLVPEAKDTKVRFFSGPEKGHPNAAYQHESNTIFINIDKYFTNNKNENERRTYLKGKVLHELQHQLQRTAGLSAGRGFDEILNRLAKETGRNPITDIQLRRQAFEEYRDQHEELESRKAEERSEFNAEERAKVPPFTKGELPEFFAQNPTGGIPNGFIYGDKIYLNPETVRLDTVIHEFGHLWWNIVRHKYPVLYAAGQRLIKGSKYKEEVDANPAYSSLSEAEKSDEAVVIAIGEKGAGIADKSAWRRFWTDLWSRLKQRLGIKQNVDMSTMTLNDLVLMAARELMTPGEIGRISNLHLPETASFRLKGFKMSSEAWEDWNKRVEADRILNLAPETWTRGVKSLRQIIMSSFLSTTQDWTRTMHEVQNEIVDSYIAKAQDEIDKLTASKETKKQFSKELKASRNMLTERLIGDTKDIHGLMDLMTGKAEYQIKSMRKWLFGETTSESGYGSIMEFLTKATTFKGNNVLDPNSFAGRVQAKGLTLLDLGFYMQVVHSLERNEYNRKLTKGETQAGSGMTDTEANVFLVEIKKSGKEDDLKTFAAEIREKLVVEPLNFQHQAGIINQKDYNQLLNYYANYVPLKVQQYQKGGQQGQLSKGIFGTGIKASHGSEQNKYWDRVNPIVHLINNYEATIAKVESNEVMKKFHKLVVQHPNEQVWKIIRPKKVVTEVVQEGQEEEGNDVGEIKTVVQDFTSPEEKRAIEKESVGVRIGGKQYFIWLKDPDLREVFVDKKPRPTKKWVISTMQVIRSIQNYQRATYIGLNLDFPLPNLVRDIQDAAVNLQSLEVKKIGRSVIGGIPTAMSTIFKKNIGKGKPDPMYSQYMDEMKAEGGEISWLDVAGHEEILKEVEQEIDRFKTLNPAQRLGNVMLYPTRKVMRGVVLINKVTEQAIRLSTYVNLREAGVSRHKAAKAAKNVTVNFNKKGSWGPFLNMAWLFANAGIQGANQMMTALIKSPKVRAMMVGLIIGQIANRFLLDALADDDDDLKKLLTESDHNKNFVLWAPWSKHQVVTVPVAYNIRPFKAVGDALYDLYRNNKDYGQAIGYVFKNFMNGIFPMAENNFYPSIVQPLVELSQNEKFYNQQPIYPEKKHLYQKDSELYFKSTDKPFIKLSGILSETFQGNDDVLEISPATMEYGMDYTLGGLKSWYKLGDQMYNVIDKQQIDYNKMPVVRRFVTDLSTQEWRTKVAFYKLYTELSRRRLSQEQFNFWKELGDRLTREGNIKPDDWNRKRKEILRVQQESFSNVLN